MSSEPPRIELATLPTPIDHLPDLSRELGAALYFKRDDLTGAALSGNKVRKLEFELAAALDADADVVLTCGGAQSNHCRTTAVAARQLGLEVELFLRGAREADIEGNLFLDLLVGAGIHAMDPQDWSRRAELMEERAREIEAEGRNVWVIPEGASTALGSLGYVRCMREIVREMDGADLSFDAIVTAVGSGGTYAGLLAGARVEGFTGRIVGVPVCDDGATFRAITEGLLTEMRDRWFPELDVSVPVDAFLEGHVGPGYARTTPEDLERLRDVAILTGLILDPTYTNKAFGGLLAMIRDEVLPPGAKVLFLHTGGLFGLFPEKGAVPGLAVP